MKREVFDDLWDKADKEHSSQGNNSFTFKHHLFAVLDDELKEQQQPQLTIPKSIAERLINFIEINHGTDFIIEELLYFKNMERSHCFEPDLKLHDFLQNNTNICVLYLAGKALGVDLVKVVAVEN